jgi:hypothetical protein
LIGRQHTRHPGPHRWVIIDDQDSHRPIKSIAIDTATRHSRLQ